MLCVHRITKGEKLVSEHATQGFEKHLVLAVLCRACPCWSCLAFARLTGIALPSMRSAQADTWGGSHDSGLA